ncbi:glutaredoxin family protein [Methylophilus sp. VKM B-3414]|uniref:glutaredoxin family protein n=1 Tax=Methylophilus sp. VKM B-3414 TaxID=3076121 RepID=UPI0028CAB85C|nr:glutaredoxin family protein [Methylophilus sp. VKM B-3414]MDT7850440.1 glutaredoxin family protein [Methylophilus sp. VKM B-3414]
MKLSPRLNFLILGTAILLAMQWHTWWFYLNPPPDFSHGQVVLYATDWCPYCEKTRALLATKGIPYKEMNIETSAEARSQYQRLAANGVPVLLVAGEVVRGYHQQRMEALLDAWQREHKPAALTK